MSKAQPTRRRPTPEQNRRSRLRAEQRHPEKIRARWMCRDAIKRGALLRQPCEKCGAEPGQAHHDDYSKPLDVRWLCHKCHVAHHAAQKRTYLPRPVSDTCKRGHLFTPENTQATSKGGRRCRECQRQLQRQHYQRRVAHQSSPSPQPY